MPAGPVSAAAAANGAAWLRLVELSNDQLPEVQQPAEAVCLEAVPGAIAHLRLSKGVPDCVRTALKGGHFCTVVQEPGAATAWVPRAVLPRKGADADGVEDIDQGRSWCVLRVGSGAAPKGGAREPPPPGTANVLLTLLTEAAIHVRMVSAFGAELLLVPEDLLAQATAVLADRGHAVFPSSRVCAPVPWRAKEVPQSDATLARQLAGAWSLKTVEEPLGTIATEYTEGGGPLRLQSPGGLFVELRFPAEGAKGAERQECSFGGRCFIVTKEDKAICTHLRAVDFQPPRARAAEAELKFGADSLEALAHPAGEQRELWARLKDGDAAARVVALELEAELPARKVTRCGFWLFVGGRFARIVGPPHGSGLVAGTCCKSLSQLQKLRGASETRQEVSEHYEAVSGVVDLPGLLRTVRSAHHSEKANAPFFSAADPATGKVEVGKSKVVFTRAGGRRETWRILEWTFDPFTGEGEKPTAPAADNETAASPEAARDPSPSTATAIGDEAPPLPLVSPSHSPTAEGEDDEEATDVAEPEATPAPAARQPSPAASEAVAAATAAAAAADKAAKAAKAAKAKEAPPAKKATKEKEKKAKKEKADKKEKKTEKKAKKAAKVSEEEARPPPKVKDKKKKKKNKKDKKKAKTEVESEEDEEAEPEASEASAVSEAEASPAAEASAPLSPSEAEDAEPEENEPEEATDLDAVSEGGTSEEQPEPPKRTPRRPEKKALLVAAKDKDKKAKKEKEKEKVKKEKKVKISGRRVQAEPEPEVPKKRERKPVARGLFSSALQAVMPQKDGRERSRSRDVPTRKKARG